MLSQRTSGNFTAGKEPVGGVKNLACCNLLQGFLQPGHYGGILWPLGNPLATTQSTVADLIQQLVDVGADHSTGRRQHAGIKGSRHSGLCSPQIEFIKGTVDDQTVTDLENLPPGGIQPDVKS